MDESRTQLPRPEVARLQMLRDELEAAVIRATAVLAVAKTRPGGKPVDLLL